MDSLAAVSDQRDPTKDPHVGDVVRGVAANPQVHRGKFAEITVQAIVGNLIATSSTGDNEIRWQIRERWCATDNWLSHWEVLHVAE